MTGEQVKKKAGKEQPSRRKTKPENHFYNLLAKGTQALHRGDVATATRLLERAHQLAPDNVDAALNLGGAYILAKKFAKAVEILEPLSQRDPHNPMVWTNLGAAYLGNPILAKAAEQLRAIAAFERALEINPATPHVAYNLGLIYLDRQELESALDYFRRAVQVNPNDRDAQNYLNQLSQPEA